MLRHGRLSYASRLRVMGLLARYCPILVLASISQRIPFFSVLLSRP